MQKKLTKTAVEQLNEPGYCRDTELKGFCVRIVLGKKSNKLTKTYLVNGKPKGRSRNITVTIGKHGVVSTEWARTEAKRIIGLMAQGINPTAVKTQEIEEQIQAELAEKIEKNFSELSLEKLLADYLEQRQLKEKTSKDYVRFTKRCLGDWLKLPIVDITRDMVQKRHLELSKEHGAQANYTMRILRALFKYAIAVYEDADGKPLLTINPVDRLKHARLWNKVPRRQTVIRPHQLKAWYKAVSRLSNLEARDVLLLELFTGLRRSEALGLKWKNVDFQHKVISIEDTKNSTEFVLPMSTYLQEMLEKRSKISGGKEHVFPSPTKAGAPICDIRDSIKQVIKHSGVEFTEHDLRRTFETIAESLDISYYTLKRLLNHKTGSDPTAGYIVTSAERMRDASQKVAASIAASMGMPAPKPSDSKAKLRRVQ